MPDQDKMQLFEDQPIRSAWNEEEERNQLSTNCRQLKLAFTDGKKYAIVTNLIKDA